MAKESASFAQGHAHQRLHASGDKTPGVGDGQGGLVCCDSWGRKESDTTERLIRSDCVIMK